MGAAAELDRILGHRENANDVAVLLLEDRHRAALLRLRLREDFGLDRRIREDLLVHEIFDLLDVLRRERLVRRVVEPKTIRADERSLLRRAVADDLAERPVKKVRR